MKFLEFKFSEIMYEVNKVVSLYSKFIKIRGISMYLGSIIQRNIDIDEDVTHRIGIGCMKQRLIFGILSDKMVTLKLKIKFYVMSQTSYVVQGGISATKVLSNLKDEGGKNEAIVVDIWVNQEQQDQNKVI